MLRNCDADSFLTNDETTVRFSATLAVLDSKMKNSGGSRALDPAPQSGSQGLLLVATATFVARSSNKH